MENHWVVYPMKLKPKLWPYFLLLFSLAVLIKYLLAKAGNVHNFPNIIISKLLLVSPILNILLLFLAQILPQDR
jgi:hypothetical protein